MKRQAHIVAGWRDAVVGREDLVIGRRRSDRGAGALV
jgi:hypothetical protein